MENLLPTINTLQKTSCQDWETQTSLCHASISQSPTSPGSWSQFLHSQRMDREISEDLLGTTGLRNSYNVQCIHIHVCVGGVYMHVIIRSISS